MQRNGQSATENLNPLRKGMVPAQRSLSYGLEGASNTP